MDGLRSVENIENLGFYYNSGLLNIALIDTYPGYEKLIIEQIDKDLKCQRRGYFDTEYKSHKCFSNNISNEEWCNQKEEEAADSLYVRPLHATLLGQYDLLTIFRGPSYSSSYSFSDISPLISLQILPGQIPVPIDGGSLRHIDKQADPDSFLQPFDHSKAMIDMPKHVCELPFLTMCRLFINDEFKNINPGNLLVPLIHIIDRCVAEIVGNQSSSIKVLLIDLSNTRDICLVFRSNSVNLAASCIDLISKISLKDIFNIWDKTGLSNGQKEATRQRFKWLISVLSNGKNPPGILELPLFSGTNTTTGAIWPIIHHALLDAKEKANKFNSVQINSEQIKAAVCTSNMPWGASFTKLNSSINHTGKKEKPAPSEKEWFLFGNFDYFIPANIISSNQNENSTSEMLINLKEFIKNYYYHRWGLIGKPENLWLELPPKGTNTTLIKNMTVILLASIQESQIPPGICKNNLINNSPTLLNRLFYRCLGFSSRDQMENIFDKLKTHGVNRYVREMLHQVFSLLQMEMLSADDAGCCIEMTDVLITWMESIHLCIDNSMNIEHTERTINFMTAPLAKAITQQALSAKNFGEIGELTPEFKGGLYKIFTGMDGLMKSVLSLVGDPYQAAGLTVVENEAGARVETLITRYGNHEYILSINHIDFMHLVHPTKILSVLHEMFHSVIESKEFIKCLDKNLLEKLKKPEKLEKDSFFSDRLKDIIVNSILCKLLFEDDLHMYSKANLLQLALTGKFRLSYPKNSDEKERQDNINLITEEVFRTFLLYLIWSHDLESLDNLLIIYREWREINKHYIPSSEDIPASRINNAIENRLKNLIKNDCDDGWKEWNKDLKSIKESIIRYFGIEAKDIKYSSDIYYRNQFYTNLRKSQENIKKLLNKNNEESSNKLFGTNDNMPVHLNFFNEKNKKTENYTLRCRRLESLIGFLVLIREFYESILGNIRIEEGKSIFLLRDDQGRIDFTKLSVNGFLADPLRGTFFTSDQKQADYHINLRLAFYKSMWHLAGIIKTWGIINLCQEQDKLSKNGEKGILLHGPLT